MNSNPSALRDSSYPGFATDESVSHSRRLRPGLQNIREAVVMEPDLMAPLVLVDTKSALKKQLVLEPVGHRETVYPVDTSQFPHLDTSAIQKG